MKKWLLAIIFILSIFIISFLNYRFGYKSGSENTLGLLRGAFVLELVALDNIQNNNVSEGIEKIETSFYSTAVILLESPKWSNSSPVEIFIPELIEYRKKFASSQSEWTPTEKRLEELLAQWKEKHNEK